MLKKFDVIRAWAIFFALNFLAIVAVSHWPGATDSQGRLFGLFVIDPIDDVFHFVSGLIALGVGLHSRKWSVEYFKYAGIPYGLDAFTGIFLGREFLNGDVFMNGIGVANFSVSSMLINLPHIIILVSMIWIGYSLSKKPATSA